MACNGMASSYFPPNFLLQMQTPHEEGHSNNTTSNHHHPPTTSLTPQLLPTAPQDYQAVAALLGRRSVSFSGMEGGCEEAGLVEDELSDDCSQVGEKKRRLNVEQVKTLEKNFELGNKLEPERKMQLARALGLQPRQIAIWFQNRRARWKTKQLEKDYDVLKKQYESLKFENDSLHAHNKKLQAEVIALRGGREQTEPINLNKETEGSCSNRSENSSDIKLHISRAPVTERQPAFFPPGAGRPPPLLLGPSRPDLLCPKMEHGGSPVAQDESFCNMICNLEDQSGFWNAWHEQQSFH